MKSYVWCIPFSIAIICGILNPCGGLVSIVAIVMSMCLLLFLQRDIGREIKYLHNKYGTSQDVAGDLSVSSWVMTAFTFAVLNLLINLTTFWFCYTKIVETNTLPDIGFTAQLFNTYQWDISCVLFILTVLFHIFGTVLIFVEGHKIKKQYAV